MVPLTLTLTLSPPPLRYFIAEQPAPAPHLTHPEGCAALCIVLVAVPRVSRGPVTLCPPPRYLIVPEKLGAKRRRGRASRALVYQGPVPNLFFFFLLSSLDLSDTKVYAP